MKAKSILIRGVLALAMVGANLTLTTPIAEAASCTVDVPNVHPSGHNPGAMNFVPSVSCTYPPLILQLSAKVQRWNGSSWVDDPGWTVTTLNYTETRIRRSLSKLCSATPGSYRGLARKNESGVWSAWAVGFSTYINCGAGGGGGGGGGGGSWSTPTTAV